MGYLIAFSTYFLVLLFVSINGKPLVPALFFFGDSVLDVGNNNNLPTIIQEHLPCGKDFVNHYPTGRFSNGKLVVDFASESLGFSTYQPAYLSLYFKGKNILNGANFASSVSGYHNSTAKLFGTLTLGQQLEFYKDYQKQLMRIAGRLNASSIISGGIYIVGAGSVDFLMNYYINPCLNKFYIPHQFVDILVQNYADFIQNLYALGARRIGVVTLTAIGCFPTSINIFGSPDDDKCVVEMNNVAVYFNQKLFLKSVNLRTMLPGLNLVPLDSYQPLYNLATKPSEYGTQFNMIIKHNELILYITLNCNFDPLKTTTG
ncbi:GDSL esterase/lipase At5g22810-like [Trifolium pratense]|uniref:GDSL esterase/lipase At5g22810-like n=1 Tax=Trifolium pratense TaxID=57577 RepID=UPI001E69166C|nr:GDSL esterase/lipase At5g22810-like [Trifolium pratense]